MAEFWRDIKPIDTVFREHSLPEMYTPNIASDDERYYVPLSETVGTRPVWIPPARGLRLHDLRQVGLPGARLGRHGWRLRLRDAR